jgi:hypothetical protein
MDILTLALAACAFVAGAVLGRAVPPARSFLDDLPPEDRAEAQDDFAISCARWGYLRDKRRGD